MPQDINYKVRFETDVSGLNRATSSLRAIKGTGVDAMDSLSERSRNASMAFQGLQSAANGNVGSIMGVAKAVRALMMGLSAGNVIMLVVMAVAWGISKVMEKLKGDYDKAAEASLKSAEAYKTYDDAIKGLLENQRKVTFSLEEQSKMLEAISGYYNDATQAVDAFSDAQKKANDTSKNVGIAGVNLNTARGKLFNAGNPEATARVELQGAREKAAIETATVQKNIEVDKQGVREKIDLAQKRLFALGGETGENPEIARAQNYLSGLKEKERGTRTEIGPERVKLLTEIQQRETELSKLQKDDWNTRAKVNTEINKQKKLLEEIYPAALENLDKMKKAEEDGYETKKDELTLQEKINKAKEIAVGLEQKKTAEVERGEKIRVKADEDLPKLKKKSEDAATASERATKMLKDPVYRQEQEKEEHRRERAIQNASRLAKQLGMKFTAGKDETSTDIEDRMAVARAREAQRRGARGAGIDRVLSAADAKQAAKVADEALKAAEAKFKKDMSDSAASLKVIETEIKNGAIALGK